MNLPAFVLASPPRFSTGLGVWSQTTGRPGTPTYANAAFAAFVPADPDFGGALEVQKIANFQRLMWMGQVPIVPGRYLRVRARVKAMAGALPQVRVAAWAGTAANVAVMDIPLAGPSVSLTQFGEVVEISAVIGTGNRPAVDMVWPLNVAFAHVGLELTGPNGGVVRFDDLVIEDVSPAYVADVFGRVDVRDFGAVGNGIANDRPAFVAAIAAAAGRTLLVSPGSYLIPEELIVTIPAEFRGTLVMPDTAVLRLQQNFDLPSYEAAMGDRLTGFRKALQALFRGSEHVSLDMRGLRVRLSAPLDVAAIVGLTSFDARRVLRNGAFDSLENAAWNTTTITTTASYNPAQAFQLTGIANVAAIPVGARVSGPGVGREVYVRARNIAAGSITLSLPLNGGSMTQPFTFQRYRYQLDLSGFQALDNFEMHDIEFICRGRSSCVMMAIDGRITRFQTCDFNRPRDRAITSVGRACQGLLVDTCQFHSSQMPMNAVDRTVIAFNVNANDAKIRNNRAVLWAHFGVLHGSGHVFVGNHFFGGDTLIQSPRQAGIVLTGVNVKTTITGNYIDNSFIEMSNEHSANPAVGTGFSFGGLTITGNIFTTNNAAPWFTWIVISPYGPGHFLQGLQVSGNVFRTIAGRIDRAESVNTTRAALDYGRFRNVIFDNNAYNGIDFPAESPTTIVHLQNSASAAWTIDGASKLPFGGWARSVSAVVMEEPARDADNGIRYDMPFAQIQQGPNNAQARLRWPVPVRGRALVTLRVDRPL